MLLSSEEASEGAVAVVTIYTYPELEQLWITEGGPADQAQTAAAIAEAESGGDPLNAYPSHDIAPGTGTWTDATGLWQILGPPSGNWKASQLTDPYANAAMAVQKYNDAGGSFSPWQTYTSGAYQQFLQNQGPSGSIPTPNDVNPTGGSAPAQTTSSLFGGGILGKLLGLTISTDMLERLGLIIFGALLIIVGVFMLAGKQTIHIASTAAKAAV